MQSTQDTLLAELAAAGVDEAVRSGLRPESPLTEQGVEDSALAALDAFVAGRAGPWPQRPQFPSLDDYAARLEQAIPHDQRVRQALDALRAGWREVPPGQDSVVDLLRPEDAPYASQLFSIVYGDKYPVADYYVPESLVRLNRQQKVFTFVARLADGSVAGQSAYFQSSAPNDGLYEFGQMLILPAYRRSSMAMNIATFMNAYSRTIERAQGFFGEAVTNHPVTQRLCADHGYTVCGFEASLMPDGAYGREGAGDTRVSVVLATRVDRDRRRPLHLPEVYRPRLTAVLDEFRLDREVDFQAADAPLPGPSRLDERVFDFAQVVRVQAHAVGEDFEARMDDLTERVHRLGLAVSQVFVNTGRPGAAFAVEALRRRGYFFGGFLPLWFGTDALLMQRLAAPPQLDGLVLHTDQARTMVEAVRADYRRAAGLV